MSKRQKRLEKLRQNPKDVSFESLRQVLEDFGFEFVRSSGSHHSFHVIVDGQIRLFVLPYRQPVKTIYVREALELIDKIERNRKEAGEDEADND